MAFRYFGFASALIAVAAASVSNAVIGAVSMVRGAVDQFVNALMAIVPTGPKLVYSDGFTIESMKPGIGLDRALQNDMRHEAGVSRRSADRNI
jgi:hypothetical protein